jgi:L-glutamine:scyllo-inosose aminotransferase
VAITLALQAGRLEPGAEVVTTPYTFVGTSGGIASAGGVPVFADVLPESYCIDPAAVEAAITERTQAVVPVHLACAMADLDRVVPVHLACAMADLDRLRELCDRRGLLLVEDCAHAHGARWRGRGAGSVGEYGTFSMQSTKLLTAGEGGAITTDDDLGAQRLHSLVNCGRKESGYDGFPEPAILSEQLRRLPDQHERRARNLERFEAAIAEVPGLSTLPRDERVSFRTAYQMIVRYDAEAFAGVPRDTAIRALHAEGVPCYGRFYVPLPEDPLFAPDPKTNPLARAGHDYQGQQYPVASRAAYDEAIWLPHELFLGDASDVDDLVAAFVKVQAAASELRVAESA